MLWQSSSCRSAGRQLPCPSNQAQLHHPFPSQTLPLPRTNVPTISFISFSKPAQELAIVSTNLSTLGVALNSAAGQTLPFWAKSPGPVSHWWIMAACCSSQFYPCRIPYSSQMPFSSPELIFGYWMLVPLRSWSRSSACRGWCLFCQTPQLHTGLPWG